MESLLHTSSATNLASKLPKLRIGIGFTRKQLPFLKFSNGYTHLGRGKPVRVEAKNKKSDGKQDNHSFIPKPGEATGFFPEAVLLKEKKVQEDGGRLPDFADAEEQELYESLNLELQSALNVDRMRHYEVVYLIHGKHAEEVGNVNDKVQDFLREKKGKVWRFDDWGLRRLAYKIKKANNAHYILMNFEMEAKWINDFKNMLDKDERIIRHLVIKRDKAITEDCPPPPEWHTLRASGDDFDEEDDGEDISDEYDDDEDFVEILDEDEEMDSYEDDDDDDDDIGNDTEDKNHKSSDLGNTGRRKVTVEKVVR